MKIEKLAAVAEIVASVAIVVTIAYLAVQTEQLSIQTAQNSEALNASARQASLDAELSVLFEISDSMPAMQAVGRLGLEEALSQFPSEVAELHLKFMALLRLRQNQWMQYKAGLFDEEQWKAFQNSTNWLWVTPSMKRLWAREQNNLHPGFVADTEAWLERLDDDAL